MYIDEDDKVGRPLVDKIIGLFKGFFTIDAWTPNSDGSKFTAPRMIMGRRMEFAIQKIDLEEGCYFSLIIKEGSSEARVSGNWDGRLHTRIYRPLCRQFDNSKREALDKLSKLERARRDRKDKKEKKFAEELLRSF